MNELYDLINKMNIAECYVDGFNDRPCEYQKMIADFFDNPQGCSNPSVSKNSNSEFNSLALSLLTPDLDIRQEIDRGVKLLPGKLLAFFVWAAKNNRVDLLNANYFVKLLKEDPNSAAESIKAAIVFGSLPYLDKFIDVLNTILELRPTKKMFQTSFYRLLTHAIDFASAFGDDKVLLLILSKLSQFDLSLKNLEEDGRSILFDAIRNNQVHMVDILLQHGANPNFHYGALCCNLHLAIKQGNSDIVKLLMNHGGNLVKQIECEVTALHQAVKQKQWQIASMLIKDYAANTQVRDKDGKTPLDYVEDEAIKQQLLADAQTQQSSPQPPISDISNMKYLLANADEKREMLNKAIKDNQVEVVDILLSNGADPNPKHVESALFLAISRENVEIIKLLFNHGCKLEKHVSSSLAGSFFNSHLVYRVTALHHAVEYKKWQIAAMLIKDYGADITLCDSDGKTPLDYIDDEAIKQQLLDVAQAQQSTTLEVKRT